MGKALFTDLGFKEAEVVQVPGYVDHPDPLEVWPGLCDAKKEHEMPDL